MHAINIKQELILIPRSISMLLRVPNRPPAPPYPDEPQHICLSEAGDSWQDQVCSCTMQHWAAVQSSPKSTKTFKWNGMDHYKLSQVHHQSPVLS